MDQATRRAERAAALGDPEAQAELEARLRRAEGAERWWLLGEVTRGDRRAKVHLVGPALHLWSRRRDTSQPPGTVVPYVADAYSACSRGPVRFWFWEVERRFPSNLCLACRKVRESWGKLAAAGNSFDLDLFALQVAWAESRDPGCYPGSAVDRYGALASVRADLEQVRAKRAWPGYQPHPLLNQALERARDHLDG